MFADVIGITSNIVTHIKNSSAVLNVIWTVSPDGHQILLAASIKNNPNDSFRFELERYMDCGFPIPSFVCVDRNEKLEADVTEIWP